MDNHQNSLHCTKKYIYPYGSSYLCLSITYTIKLNMPTDQRLRRGLKAIQMAE